MSAFWTPAHHADEHDDAEALARLLADGADPDEVFSNMTLLTHAIDAELADPDGRTPADIAARYGHDLALNLLRAHINRRAAGSRS
ncbi:ankyrin repeat domain-containing protein [Streptomyces sp. NPDC005381]|uniref:ankyrin repeat domain-containing protein n=1 Tax=Streptomyces sp. NPDC005381 TaxID=3364714 RepID=UPI00367839E9